MPTIANIYTFIVGVDTHARSHTYAVIASNGEQIATKCFPNSPAGRKRAMAWVARRTHTEVEVVWVIEGVGSYGALLAGEVSNSGYLVVEAPRRYAPARRGS